VSEETNSARWTLISTFLPIALGLIVTFFTTQIYMLMVGS
jgi:ferrous iron transport protein B